MSVTSQDKTAHTGWRQLRYVVAAILFIAAAAKIANWVQILAGDGLLSNRSLLLSVIGIEAVVGTFLCLAPPAASWRVTIFTFGVLAMSASYAIVTGKDCNCISDAIKPEFMLLLDTTVLALAIWYRPSPNDTAAGSRTGMNVLASLVVGLLFVAAAFFREHSVVHGRGGSDGPVEFLIADMLLDKPWPLTPQIHPHLEPLQTGRWLVMIVRRDCEHCKELLAEFFATPDRHRPDERTAIFVAGKPQWPFQVDRVTMEVDGDAVIRWPDGEPFVASPAIFILEDGRVTNAADGEESHEFCSSLFDE